ncbi:substrate-binding periplasmic protein [Spartinivicinus poritis]|uniref:Transporter substrate-binding domain-containing protein n=1 Tax=Spartinivicinus poritis TaxID=2994640 RepID=A0ABT5UFJ2_9GAMM|nr:transporter substrate-binding domain-containing protein [Spartinivicinus sp. A2-2]MDE1464277.1 transporter substrate-binding domain-containing protein [Spartinivicinus sp. A2-2]
MIKRYWLLIVALLLYCFQASADKIILASDYWCPINCEPNSNQEGFMIDIARRVFTEQGHQIEYQLMPWNRTLSMVRSGKIHGAVGPYIDDCPDFIFPKNELAMIGFSVYVKKDSSWLYNNISSLEEIRLGVAANYAYGQELDLYIEKHKTDRKRLQINYGNLPVESNIRMLLSDRVDAVVATQLVFLHIVNKLNVSNQLKSAGTINKPKKAYIAFSPALQSSDEYAKILSDGVAELRKSGELTEILSKYGLTDWKK